MLGERASAHGNAAVDDPRTANGRQANQADAADLQESQSILLKNPVNHPVKSAAQLSGMLKRNLAAVKRGKCA